MNYRELVRLALKKYWAYRSLLISSFDFGPAIITERGKQMTRPMPLG